MPRGFDMTQRARPLRIAISFGFLFAITVIAAERLYSQAAPAITPQTAPTPVVLKGKLERVKVHGKSLEGNLMGETPSPEVSIYLPPSYQADPARRFPVVYLLHG